MSIVAAPEDKRAARYRSVRQNMADAIRRFGMEGAQAEDCLARNMGAIHDIIPEVEMKGRSEPAAAQLPDQDPWS
ncbi:MAG: hypothetical protein ACHQAY_27645 [Hyphomicrobiales bacterium]